MSEGTRGWRERKITCNKRWSGLVGVWGGLRDTIAGILIAITILMHKTCPLSERAREKIYGGCLHPAGGSSRARGIGQGAAVRSQRWAKLRISTFVSARMHMNMSGSVCTQVLHKKRNDDRPMAGPASPNDGYLPATRSKSASRPITRAYVLGPTQTHGSSGP
jgi:hypothetical protein